MREERVAALVYSFLLSSLPNWEGNAPTVEWLVRGAKLHGSDGKEWACDNITRRL